MASPSWIILLRTPRVRGTGGHGDADLYLELVEPPLVSRLTVATRINPNPITPRNYPFVLAADPSGLFLLSANQGRPLVDRPRGKLLGSFVPEYFVCDATSASMFRLPDPEGNIDYQGNFGLIVAPGGSGHYMAAELQPIIGSDSATLLYFSSETGEWAEKNLRYPLPCRPWGSAGVISFEGKLWWVDLSWGLLTCDPFADTPLLRFVSLPEDKLLPLTCCGSHLDKYRCVNVSKGKLRFVEMSSGECGAPTVGMWTLEENTAEWTLEYEVRFDEIWADESYKASGLPGKAPVLGLVHPKNPDVVYFFLTEYLFGVDMRAKRLEQCALHKLFSQPPKYKVCSDFVLACEVPPSLIKDMPSWVIWRYVPRMFAANMLGDAKLALDLAMPASVSNLTVVPRIPTNRITPRYYTFVIAADPSGLFLLSANQGRPTCPFVVNQPRRKPFLLRSFDTEYFVCGATFDSVFCLPDPEDNIDYHGNFGLIAAPGGNGHYMAAELQPIIGSDSATLLYFTSKTGQWGKKNMHYPLPCRPWGSDGVISFDGKLWWVDLSWGLLTCDPFADTPLLCFVSLPKDKLLPLTHCGGDLGKYRCVNVSNGKLRFVELSSGECVAPTVSMWTLVEEKTAEWTLEYEVKFDKIWAHECYVSTELPLKAPELVLVNPKNPYEVYFILEEYLFGVDMHDKWLTVLAPHEHVGQPPTDEVCSDYFLAYELPPSLTKEMPSWVILRRIPLESAAN